jgi:hypothetical protein
MTSKKMGRLWGRPWLFLTVGLDVDVDELVADGEEG